MRKHATAWGFGLLVFALHSTICVPFIIGLPIPLNFITLLAAVFHVLISLGLALDLAELLLSCVLSPKDHCGLPNVDASTRTRVAILYVCCDDTDPLALEKLSALSDFDLYILDDSRTEESQSIIDATSFTVIRREDRQGYKAGNLNYWLQRWGRPYDYFVVLDSDSIMTPAAVWHLLRYAEHPQNKNVAIVQACIMPRTGNLFQEVMSTSASVRERVFTRLHGRIGWALSHGHNNLHRTQAVLDAGGFPTDASCEDTLLTLSLAARGWDIIYVDVVTHDAFPIHVIAYRRRQIRWARQTVEAILASRVRSKLSHGLLMARHLFSYLLPSLCLASLASAAAVGVCGRYGLAFSSSIPTILSEQCEWMSRAFTISLLCFLTIVILRAFVLHRDGTPLRRMPTEIVLMVAVTGFCSFSVLYGMLASFLGRRVGFTPTGSSCEGRLHLVEIIRQMLIPWAIYTCVSLCILSFALPNKLVFLSIFAVLLAASPVILRSFHMDQIEQR